MDNQQGLLYSTWNSAQCYVVAWMGGGFVGEWMNITETLRYSLATITTLLISYSPIPNKSSKGKKKRIPLIRGGKRNSTTGRKIAIIRFLRVDFFLICSPSYLLPGPVFLKFVLTWLTQLVKELHFLFWIKPEHKYIWFNLELRFI